MKQTLITLIICMVVAYLTFQFASFFTSKGLEAAEYGGEVIAKWL